MLPRIPVAQPCLNGNEKAYVANCLDSTWISAIGDYLSAFEREFAKYCGVKYGVATNNGTTALHLALVALGIGPGDSVIVPTLTYVAVPNAVRYCQATPILVDCEATAYNINPALIEAKIRPDTKAIIVVHVYGHPVDMDPIMEIARRHNLLVIEDAAEAHGAEYKGRRVGGLGHCSTFSFFGNKIITTGEGGMVLTNDQDLANKLRIYGGQGQDQKRRYWFPVIGYNYRMTNIAAAIGLAQLECIDTALAARVQLAQWYEEALAPLVGDEVELPQTESWARHAFWMYTVKLKRGGEAERDKLMAALAQSGIETRPVFYPMHVLPIYQEPKSDYPVATSCAARGLNLPTHAFVTREDVDRIAGAMRAALQQG
jgi:perosamine synthetase